MLCKSRDRERCIYEAIFGCKGAEQVFEEELGCEVDEGPILGECGYEKGAIDAAA